MPTRWIKKPPRFFANYKQKNLGAGAASTGSLLIGAARILQIALQMKAFAMPWETLAQPALIEHSATNFFLIIKLLFSLTYNISLKIFRIIQK